MFFPCPSVKFGVSPMIFCLVSDSENSPCSIILSILLIKTWHVIQRGLHPLLSWTRLMLSICTEGTEWNCYTLPPSPICNFTRLPPFCSLIISNSYREEEKKKGKKSFVKSATISHALWTSQMSKLTVLSNGEQAQIAETFLSWQMFPQGKANPWLPSPLVLSSAFYLPSCVMPGSLGSPYIRLMKALCWFPFISVLVYLSCLCLVHGKPLYFIYPMGECILPSEAVSFLFCYSFDVSGIHSWQYTMFPKPQDTHFKL